MAEVPEKIDLAVIVTPAETVPGVIKECVQADVLAAIIISAGFRECGPQGAELEREVREYVKGSGLRVIGPNCLGVMNPHTGLNATFAGRMAQPGKVGFISQSGALGTAVLDWSFKESVGFSAFISLGSMLDIGWGDMIDYLGDDPHTQSILIYMESIGDARSFLSAAREVALNKPIIIIKAGRTEAASKAAASHTGALTGSDDVLDAAFQRCGVLRVDHISDLFNMAEVLAKQPRPKGPKLAILTNAGGPGVLATDAIIAAGGELAELSEKTIQTLNPILPPHWSHANPVDILGDADAERYAKTLEVIAKDSQSDGVLVILTPQAMTDPTQTAERLKGCAKLNGKPLLASWMGGLEVEKGRNILNQADIPVFEYPDTAALMFHYMWQYSRNLRSLYETPVLPSFEAGETLPNRGLVEEMIVKARKAGRTILTEFESKQILKAYGILTVETILAKNADEAVRCAEKIGYPVVLKLHSEMITHKTDVGGVLLNLSSASMVLNAFETIQSNVQQKGGKSDFLGVTVQPFVKKEGYELILGSSIDPQFGPVLLFGAGGELVEILKDRALGLPPLNTTLARRMMECTRIFSALQGVRGRKPVNLSALDELLVLFSHLVIEQPWIKEMDLNPLLASSEGVLALDARVVLHDPAMEQSKLPKPVIRPYPVQYLSQWTMKDSTSVTIRPIRPEDEPFMVKFHKTLSDSTVHLRFFESIKLDQRVAHERLVRRCFNDYDREIALVADYKNPSTEEHEIIAVARLSKLRERHAAEFAVVVSDPFQHRGLGTELTRRLLEVCRQENIPHLAAEMLPENFDMQHICKKLGFQIKPAKGGIKAEIEIV
jgi:acetyltransferase